MNEILNLPPQASSVAPGIDHLHYAIILTTFAGIAAIGLVTLYFVLRYRRRDDGPTPRVESPPWLELSVGGGLFALFLVWWLIGFSQYRTLETPPADAMPVYATAKQWMWEFAYPSGPTSTDVLVVPVGKPVKVILSARDVLHGFYVPAFRIKQDAVPGHATFTWFTAVEPGTYDLMCSQYCGTRHSLMRGSIVALAPDDFARWLAAASTTGKGDGAGLAARGRQLATAHGCLRCHSTDGTRLIGPTFLHAFGRLDEAAITESLMDPKAVIAPGYQPVMPSYQGILDPADVGALVEYIRSLR